MLLQLFFLTLSCSKQALAARPLVCTTSNSDCMLPVSAYPHLNCTRWVHSRSVWHPCPLTPFPSLHPSLSRPSLLLQDPGTPGEGRPGHPEAEVVAAHGPLRPEPPHQCTARRTLPQAAQLRRRLLHPGRRPAAGLPRGRHGDMVERQPVPPGAAQRGDRAQGPSDRPVGGGHCHTLL